MGRLFLRRRGRRQHSTPSFMSMIGAVTRTRAILRQLPSTSTLASFATDNRMASGSSAAPPSTPTVLLSSFSTCELSDALIKLGVPHGGHIPDIHAMNDQSSQTTLCGPAYTIKMVWSGSKDEKLVLEEGKHWVDTVPKGSVVVISAPSSELQSAYSNRYVHIHCFIHVHQIPRTQSGVGS